MDQATLEPETVEAARQNIIDNYIEDGWELPILNAHLDDLVAAVRAEERARIQARYADPAWIRDGHYMDFEEPAEGEVTE